MLKNHCEKCDAIIKTNYVIIPVAKNLDGYIKLKDHSNAEKDICLYCLIDAINKLDNRPKEAGKK